MFYHISGELVHTELNAAVIDCNGVGYRLTVSANTIGKLSAQKSGGGGKAKLFTHLCVREDGIELFGFFTLEELSAFKMLISVSGIGPKAAMSVLSMLSPERFALAVTTEDAKLLAKAPGIGAKTAARIILELKDKISKELKSGGADTLSADDLLPVSRNDKLSDAQNTLIVLGYSRTEAISALRNIDTEKLSLEDIIREALKKLMKN